MSVTDIVLPVVKGVLVGVVGLCALYGLWVVIKWTGLIEWWLLRKYKPSEDIFDYVLEHVAEEKSFEELAEHFANMDLKTQRKYINAWLEIKKAERG